MAARTKNKKRGKYEKKTPNNRISCSIWFLKSVEGKKRSQSEKRPCCGLLTGDWGRLKPLTGDPCLDPWLGDCDWTGTKINLVSQKLKKIKKKKFHLQHHFFTTPTPRLKRNASVNLKKRQLEFVVTAWTCRSLKGESGTYRMIDWPAAAAARKNMKRRVWNRNSKQKTEEKKEKGI